MSKRTLTKYITPEVAMAIQKGERDHAYLLTELDFVRPQNPVATIDNLNENQKLGFNNLERRLRSAH